MDSMPYFACPSCHLTHFSATVRALDKTCPRCTKTLGKDVELLVADTLAAARALASSTTRVA